MAKKKQENQDDEVPEEEPQGNDSSSDNERPNGCCTCPHGWAGALTIASVWIAWALTNLATGHCELIRNNDDQSVGLVQFEDSNGDCTLFNDADVLSNSIYDADPQTEADLVYDGVWRVARLISLLAVFLTLLLAIAVTTASCWRQSVEKIQYASFLAVAATLPFGLTFMVFGSDICKSGDCEWGVASYVMLLGVLVWFGGAAALWYVGSTAHQQPKQRGSSWWWLFGVASASAVVIIVLTVTLVATLRSGDNVPGVTPPNDDDDETGIWELAVSDTGAAASFLLTSTNHSHFFDPHVVLSGTDYAAALGSSGIVDRSGFDWEGLPERIDLYQRDSQSLRWRRDDSIPLNPDRVANSVLFVIAKETADTIVVAYGGNGGLDDDVSVVQTFKKQAGVWNSWGSPLTGVRIGAGLALDADGSTLAVASLYRTPDDWDGVAVSAYEASNDGWVRLGSPMRVDDWDYSGHGPKVNLALSSGGTTLAMGVSTALPEGRARVWQLRQNEWVAVEEDVAPADRVALSADGTILATAVPLLQGGGDVQVHQLESASSSWRSLGQRLYCGFQTNVCGNDIALSQDGLTLAYGDGGALLTLDGVESRGMVQVVRYNEQAQQWFLTGQVLSNTNVGDGVRNDFLGTGHQLDLNGAGDVLALGLPTPENGPLYMQIWEYTTAAVTTPEQQV